MCQGGAFGCVSHCVSVNHCGLHLVKTGCGFFLLDCVILSVCVCVSLTLGFGSVSPSWGVAVGAV